MPSEPFSEVLSVTTGEVDAGTPSITLLAAAGLAWEILEVDTIVLTTATAGYVGAVTVAGSAFLFLAAPAIAFGKDTASWSGRKLFAPNTPVVITWSNPVGAGGSGLITVQARVI